MQSGKRKHGRFPDGVVVEKRQRGDQGQGGKIDRPSGLPVTFIEIQAGHHAQHRHAVVARLAEVQQELRRPGGKQEHEERQPRTVRQVPAHDQIENPQREYPGQGMDDSRAGFVKADHRESRRRQDVLQRRRNVS